MRGYITIDVVEDLKEEEIGVDFICIVCEGYRKIE